MILPLTILRMPLWSNTLLVIMASMVMTMVVVMAMGLNNTLVIPVVAMTMVMSMMVTMPVTTPGVFLYSWGGVCVRLCVCSHGALHWCVSALVCAVPTYASAVGISDRTLNMTLSDDGVRKRDVVGETTTPVINEKVIFLSGQCLPDIRLLLLLFVEGDVLCQSLGQHGVQALCLLPLLVNHHVDHVLQTLTLQLLAQAIHSGSLYQAEQSAGL